MSPHLPLGFKNTCGLLHSLSEEKFQIKYFQKISEKNMWKNYEKIPEKIAKKLGFYKSSFQQDFSP